MLVSKNHRAWDFFCNFNFNFVLVHGLINYVLNKILFIYCSQVHG